MNNEYVETSTSWLDTHKHVQGDYRIIDMISDRPYTGIISCTGDTIRRICDTISIARKRITVVREVRGTSERDVSASIFGIL